MSLDVSVVTASVSLHFGRVTTTVSLEGVFAGVTGKRKKSNTLRFP